MNKTLLFFLLSIFIKVGAQEAPTLIIGDSLYSLGEFKSALTEYKKATPSHHRELKIAKSYVAIGNNTAALLSYQELLKTAPNDITVAYTYGKLALQMGKLVTADSVFASLTEQYPFNVNFLYQKGVVSEKLKAADFIETYRLAYKVDSTHSNTLYKLAKFSAEKRAFETAKTFINKGLEIDDASIRFIKLDALVSYFLKEYHNAIRSNNKLVVLNAGSQIGHEHLALSYAKTLQFEKAIDQYTILINEYDDQIAKWHFNLGKSYMALRYLDKAQRHMEIAIALLDIPLDGHYVALATLFGKKKEYENQMKTFEKAIKENPQNELARFSLATTADNFFEDKKAAIPYYERYLKQFGEKGQFSNLIKSRIKDIKTDNHFNKD